MIKVYFILLAIITIYLSIKLSYYADILNKNSKISSALIGGILLAGITSLPEFVTCLTAIFCHNPYLAIGDIFGSNFFNIVMICFFDLIFIKKMVFNRLNQSHLLVYILLIINYITIYLSMVGLINFNILNVGLPSIIIIITYCYYFFTINNNEKKVNNIKVDNRLLFKFILTSIFMIITSILLTITVNKIASINLTFSSSIIGAILLGVITSLPEVITFVTLVKLNNYDLALSNIIGSNLFNLLVLAISDFFLKRNQIYNYIDKAGLYLLILGFISIVISLFQCNHRKIKNKVIYILPSLIIIFLYIYFWILNYK